MKTNYICLAIVNFICIVFIAFTIFSQFGTNIQVIKAADAYPIDVATRISSRYSGKTQQSYNDYTRVVKVKAKDADIDPVWVDAKYVFGTEDEKELKAMVDNKDIVKLNFFVNPKTNKTLGVTVKGASKWSLFYNNNKLLKYGLIVIPCVDLFVIAVIFLKEKKKATKRNK